MAPKSDSNFRLLASSNRHSLGFSRQENLVPEIRIWYLNLVPEEFDIKRVRVDPLGGSTWRVYSLGRSGFLEGPLGGLLGPSHRSGTPPGRFGISTFCPAFLLLIFNFINFFNS